MISRLIGRRIPRQRSARAPAEKCAAITRGEGMSGAFPHSCYSFILINPLISQHLRQLMNVLMFCISKWLFHLTIRFFLCALRFVSSTKAKAITVADPGVRGASLIVAPPRNSFRNDTRTRATKPRSRENIPRTANEKLGATEDWR